MDSNELLKDLDRLLAEVGKIVTDHEEYVMLGEWDMQQLKRRAAELRVGLQSAMGLPTYTVKVQLVGSTIKVKLIDETNSEIVFSAEVPNQLQEQVFEPGMATPGLVAVAHAFFDAAAQFDTDAREGVAP